jgi:hypothetical protein
MLIDDFMPKYDFSETHDITIRARAERVYNALNEANLCESPIIRWLFFLRGLPSRKTTLRDMRQMRFEMLGESLNREILLGLAGQFWTIRGNLQKINRENFKEFHEEGFAKAVWDFSLEEASGETKLTTKTRIECLDANSRKSFGFYWTFIQPFSGLIRKEMLKTVKRKAERETETR